MLVRSVAGDGVLPPMRCGRGEAGAAGLLISLLPESMHGT
jgi:hypothetical protein